MIARDGTWTAARTSRIGRLAVYASTLALLALSAFLLARRATGDIHSPLAIPLLIPTAIVLVAWAWLVRFAVHDSVPVDDRASSGKFASQDPLVFRWLPTISIVAFAIAASFPGTRITDWLVWPSALAAVVLGPTLVLQRLRRGRFSSSKRSGDFLAQNLKRYRTAEGLVLVRGTLAAEFLPTQRTATLYAAFCPPFEYLPRVETRALNAAANVKVTQLLHSGLQLEVRLARDAKSKRVVTVELFATELRAAS